MFTNLIIALVTITAPPAASPPSAECYLKEDRGAAILNVGADNVVSVRAGAQIKLDPHYTTFPGTYYKLSPKCLKKWKVSDPKIVRLSKDHKVLTVAADAPVGAEFTVTAIHGKRVINQTYKVFVPVQSALVGFWSQEKVDACVDGTAMFDLVFEADGDFSVAFGPKFHGSKDYYGKWRAEGNRLFLTGITEKPEGFAEEAVFTITEDGKLSFDRPWFGRQGQRGTCTAPFQRLG